MGPGLSPRARAAIAALATTMVGCLQSPGGGNDAAPSGPLLINGAFEDGVAGWTTDGVELATTETLGLPVSEAGPHVALLGREDNVVDRLKQDVVVPADAHSLQLSGLRCFNTDEGTQRAFDSFTIYLLAEDGLTSDILMESSNLDATPAACDWLPFEIATEDHAGERVRLILEAVMDADLQTSFAVDGLALVPGP